jgi:hypothetical protein
MFSNSKSIQFTFSAPTRMNIIHKHSQFSGKISFETFLSTPKGKEIFQMEDFFQNEFKLYKEYLAYFDIQKLKETNQKNVIFELERIEKEIESFYKKKNSHLPTLGLHGSKIFLKILKSRNFAAKY